jgi:ABC-type spermidine/putrescine transport system permease subunit II
MNDDVRSIVLGVVAAGISAALGWLARTSLWKRRLRRKQAFFG